MGTGENVSRNTHSNADLETALRFATEFRDILRRAIDAEWPATPFASPEGILKVIMRFVTSAVHGAFEAIMLLCREGWGVESDVVLRQLQEAVVNARAMKRNRSVLFLYAEELERLEALDRTGSSLPKVPDMLLPTSILSVPPNTDEVAWYQSGKSKRKRRHWKALSMETRLRIADLDASVWYRTYSDLCHVVHAGPGGMVSYLDDDSWGTVCYGPNRKQAFRSVVGACGLITVHLGTLDSLFSLGIWKDTETSGKTMLQFLQDRPSA